MPCIVKVRIERAKDLGNSSLSSPGKTPESLVEIRLAGLKPQLTHSIKSFNPVWDEDFRFEVSDDRILQDGPLQLRAMDNSTNETFGYLMIDLNPLMAADSPYVLNGWFPLFDSVTMSKCGELLLQARFQFFGDSNPFKESSAGVQFYGESLPPGLKGVKIIGLVDFEFGAHDPEYEWSESFRSARSSNLTSTRVFFELSGQLRRQLGRKVLEMGGNTVLEFKQAIDLEPSAKRITVRGLGTAAKIYSDEEDDDSTSSSESESDSDEETGVELLTVNTMPENQAISAIGGVVAARSVKLFSQTHKYSTTSAVEDLDHWLNDVREEVKSHAKLLNCSVVLGYTEQVTIWNELYIVTAMGTAVKIAKKRITTNCAFCHISYKRHQAPFSVDFVLCRVCRKRHVPQVILSTAKCPIPTSFSPIRAFFCKIVKANSNKEAVASAISSALPFIEYDLHRQLIYKLRILGCNALFNLVHHSLQIQVDSVDDTISIIAMASGDACFLNILPLPPVLKIDRSAKVKDEEDRLLVNVQHELTQLSLENHDIYEKQVVETLGPDALLSDSDAGSSTSEEYEAAGTSSTSSSSSSSEDEEIDALAVMQIDDEADEELIKMLSLRSKESMPTEELVIFKSLPSVYSSFDLARSIMQNADSSLYTLHPIVLDAASLVLVQCAKSPKSPQAGYENYGTVSFHFIKEVRDFTGLLTFTWREDIKPAIEGFVRGIGADRFGPVQIAHVSKDQGGGDGITRIVISLYVDILKSD
jgi:hypothetical protein